MFAHLRGMLNGTTISFSSQIQPKSSPNPETPLKSVESPKLVEEKLFKDEVALEDLFKDEEDHKKEENTPQPPLFKKEDEDKTLFKNEDKDVMAPKDQKITSSLPENPPRLKIRVKRPVEPTPPVQEDTQSLEKPPKKKSAKSKLTPAPIVSQRTLRKRK